MKRCNDNCEVLCLWYLVVGNFLIVVILLLRCSTHLTRLVLIGMRLDFTVHFHEHGTHRLHDLILLQMFHHLLESTKQIVGQGVGQVGLEHDPKHAGLHRFVAAQGRQRAAPTKVFKRQIVSTDVPMEFANGVLNGKIRIVHLQVGVETGRKDGQAGFLVAIANFKERFPVHLEVAHLIAKAIGHVQLALDFGSIPLLAQSQKLVRLHVRPRGRSGKVERHAIRHAAQIRDAHRNVLGQIVTVTKDEPPGTAHGFAKFVSARRHAQDVGQAKIKGGHVFLKGCDKAPRRTVHVNAHLPPLFGIDFGHDLVQIPNGIVRTIVMIAQNAHHGNGLVVNLLAHLFGIDAHLVLQRG
mmetsp:Transcript_5387/g.11071  ORF Transcript_5387/g.11071 Transcript_5387/m.11071 type:complete len:353 (+) Transcript_5387:22-1080(+)